MKDSALVAQNAKSLQVGSSPKGAGLQSHGKAPTKELIVGHRENQVVVAGAQSKTDGFVAGVDEAGKSLVAAFPTVLSKIKQFAVEKNRHVIALTDTGAKPPGGRRRQTRMRIGREPFSRLRPECHRNTMSPEH